MNDDFLSKNALTVSREINTMPILMFGRRLFGDLPNLLGVLFVKPLIWWPMVLAIILAMVLQFLSGRTVGTVVVFFHWLSLAYFAWLASLILWWLMFGLRTLKFGICTFVVILII